MLWNLSEIKKYLFFATETWLTDIVNHTIAIIKSYGYKIHHCFCETIRGGGVAIIYKS